MSMSNYGVQGYGFSIDNVPWNKVKVIEKFDRESYNLFLKDKIQSGYSADQIETFILNNSLFKGENKQIIFEKMFEKLEWLCYEDACSDCQYAILYSALPWTFHGAYPISEEAANKMMWDTIRYYVNVEFTFDNFLDVVDIIDDTYFG